MMPTRKDGKRDGSGTKVWSVSDEVYGSVRPVSQLHSFNSNALAFIRSVLSLVSRVVHAQKDQPWCGGF